MSNKPSRRSFLKSSATSASVLAASSGLGVLHAATPVHQGTGKLKIGVVGIGGRGAGAAVQATMAHKENVLYAVGDAFADRLEGGVDGVLETLTENNRKDQFDVAPERRFVGLDVLDKVLATGVDAVVLATPPGFRPMQIEKAVNKGVHVFAEKPVATDAPGVRRVMAACQLAKKKGISVVSGLCYRYHDARRATVQKLQEGAIGEVLSMQGSYVTGELWFRKVEPHWGELQRQVRNWLYYTYLSGDHIAEQHIHTLDMMAWIKGDVPPAVAMGFGGRQKRTDPKFGNVYDHFSTIYEWEDGTRGHAYCRQQAGCSNEVNEFITGTEGKANVFRHQITGKNSWKFADKSRYMYQAEHDEMFDGIRKGKPINNGEYMCKSTMMALMGRMAAYTGKRITWDQAWNSQEVLMPELKSWDDTPPKSEIAIPGITKFV